MSKPNKYEPSNNESKLTDQGWMSDIQNDYMKVCALIERQQQLLDRFYHAVNVGTDRTTTLRFLEDMMVCHIMIKELFGI